MSAKLHILTHNIDPPFYNENFMTMATIGIIGGSGLYKMDALENIQEHTVDTPFGKPSDKIISGTIDTIPVVFLARHGQGHRLIPSEVPYQSNIYALKKMGVRYLLSFSAVGSLSETIAPLDMVIPDQFIDLTKYRNNTFFGAGAVAHVSMASPICTLTAHAFTQAITDINTENKNNEERHKVDTPISLHTTGTYVCVEGPQFSSMAESRWFRSMGAHIIGMTNMPEAKLAREAQIAYASLGMVTDFDCWHPKEEHVNANMALMNLLKNSERAQKIAIRAVHYLDKNKPTSIAHDALANSLVTPLDSMNETTRQRVSQLLE